MPIKLRKLTRRLDDETLLQAWSTMFESGFDYFNDLGFPNEADAHVAARAAWKRLGRRFLTTWKPKGHRTEPWALVAFGSPV